MLSARIAGNIGTPLTSLPVKGKDNIIVLELSSYQLETTPTLSAEIRVILNITLTILRDTGDGMAMSRPNKPF